MEICDNEWRADHFLVFLESVHAPSELFKGSKCILNKIVNDTRAYLELNETEANSVGLIHATFPTNYFALDRRITEMQVALKLEPVFNKATITINRMLKKDFKKFADFGEFRQKYREKRPLDLAGNVNGIQSDNIVDIESILATSKSTAITNVVSLDESEPSIIFDFIKKLDRRIEDGFTDTKQSHTTIENLCHETKQKIQAIQTQIAKHSEEILLLKTHANTNSTRITDLHSELQTKITDLQSKIHELSLRPQNSRVDQISDQLKFSRHLARCSLAFSILRTTQANGEAIMFIKNDKLLKIAAGGLVLIDGKELSDHTKLNFTKIIKLSKPGQTNSKENKRTSKRFFVSAPRRAQSGSVSMEDVIANRRSTHTDFSVRWSTPTEFSPLARSLYTWKKNTIILDYDYARNGLFIIFLTRLPNDSANSLYSATHNSRDGSSYFVVNDPFGLMTLTDPSTDLLRQIGIQKSHFIHEGELVGTVLQIETPS